MAAGPVLPSLYQSGYIRKSSAGGGASVFVNGMLREDVEDFRQQELRLVTQCRDQEAGLDSLRQLRTAAGKVTAKRLASGAEGCKELLALTPRGEELHEMVASCDDTSLEQLQERALELLSTLHRETARRVGALLDSHGHAHTPSPN